MYPGVWTSCEACRDEAAGLRLFRRPLQDAVIAADANHAPAERGGIDYRRCRMDEDVATISSLQ